MGVGISPSPLVLGKGKIRKIVSPWQKSKENDGWERQGMYKCLAHGRRMVDPGWVGTNGDMIGGHICPLSKDIGKRRAHRPLGSRAGSEGCRVSLILDWQTGTTQKNMNGKHSTPIPTQSAPAWSSKSQRWVRKRETHSWGIPMSSPMGLCQMKTQTLHCRALEKNLWDGDFLFARADLRRTKYVLCSTFLLSSERSSCCLP